MFHIYNRKLKKKEKRIAYLIKFCLPDYRHPQFIFPQILRLFAVFIGSLHLFFAVYFSTNLLLSVFFFCTNGFFKFKPGYTSTNIVHIFPVKILSSMKGALCKYFLMFSGIKTLISYKINIVLWNLTHISKEMLILKRIGHIFRQSWDILHLPWSGLFLKVLLIVLLQALLLEHCPGFLKARYYHLDRGWAHLQISPHFSIRITFLFYQFDSLYSLFVADFLVFFYPLSLIYFLRDGMDETLFGIFCF